MPRGIPWVRGLGKRVMLCNVAEDFKKYTLTALPTLLEKLIYISSLQSGGRYQHWGLTRTFGESRAQKGIGSVHSELATQLIRIPLRNIYREYCEAAETKVHSQLLNPESLTLKAPSNGDELLSSHLRLIQHSLAAVAGRSHSSHQAA